MKTKLEVTEKEYLYYLKYCKLVSTNPKEDLTTYVKARAEETENYITKYGLDNL